MKCYFCHNPLPLYACDQHPVWVNNFLNAGVFFTLTINKKSPKIEYIFQLQPLNQTLTITKFTDNEETITVDKFYVGPIPLDLTPENANNFLDKLLSLKAFL